MLASSFIADQKAVLDENGGANRYEPSDLYTNLKKAYDELQKSYPLFKGETTLQTVVDQREYEVVSELLDISFVSVDGTVYIKKQIDRFYEMCFSSISEDSEMFAVDFDKVLINPLPQENNKDIKVVYSYLKQMEKDEETENESKEFYLPVILEEALRLRFLSFCFEVVPDRENRNLSIHYLKLFKAEIEDVKKRLKKAQRGVKTNYRIV